MVDPTPSKDPIIAFWVLALGLMLLVFLIYLLTKCIQLLTANQGRITVLSHPQQHAPPQITMVVPVPDIRTADEPTTPPPPYDQVVNK